MRLTPQIIGIALCAMACTVYAIGAGFARYSGTLVHNLSNQQNTYFDTTEFDILDSATGNLNLDNYSDKIIILKHKHEDIASSSARPVLLLLGQEDNTYMLHLRNDSVVLCLDCGGIYGDPYVDVIIENHTFTIQHYGGSGWRWSRDISFAYNAPQNCWLLSHDGGVYYHAAEPDSLESTLNNVDQYGLQKFEDYNNSF